MSWSRRGVLGGLAWAATSGSPAAAPSDTFDLIITGGRIVDGSGAPAFEADVGVRGDRIAAVADLSRAAGRRLAVNGRVVCPGFIDMHSHASWTYLVDPRGLAKLAQGVTLEIEGEGQSVAPMDAAAYSREKAQFDRFGIIPDWGSLDQFYRRLERDPAALNFATHLGTSTVREAVIGFGNRSATPEELARMRAMTRDAMRDGALGIYSALMYSPDVYNSTDELIAMAKVASEYGGYYQTHQRSESSAIDASLDEIFRIAREARISAHITHFKVTQTQNWGRMAQVLERIEVARAEGLDVTADLYPYEWAGGSFTALLPPWVQDGGRAEIMRRLRDGPTRDRIKADLVTPTLEWENEYLGAGGGPAGILIVNANGNRDLERYEGKTVADIARAEERDPRDVVLDIILAGDASMVVHITNEPDLRLAIARPWMMVGSDGSGRTAPDGPLARGGVHPRGSGTFPKVFNDYVRTSPILTLEEFVRRCTSLSAKRLSLKSRGMLRPGYFADIVVFDPDQYRDHATYEKPRKLATGVDHVLVNGAITFFDGAWTGARAGRPLRGPGWRRG